MSELDELQENQRLIDAGTTIKGMCGKVFCRGEFSDRTLGQKAIHSFGTFIGMEPDREFVVGTREGEGALNANNGLCRNIIPVQCEQNRRFFLFLIHTHYSSLSHLSLPFSYS